ncbi:VOC family protein [Piscibacillus halophilus]|uniref:Glyoxalase-like domain-containing protein n=1 Tax=Piscibacillus halophilus TaxID=571933 RepID=A0A1H9LR49_9BACI|nr:VOC family protein [Piscibacillus halophilus]SER13729.1 Glyoxalase-like domain-containing protein [Piscibacillus halophilus]
MLAFDHLVIFSNDPKRHQEIFSSSHKQVGVSGGQHDNWGTYNHLAFYKNNAYIEWLGIEKDEKAKSSENPLIQHAYFAKKKDQEGPIQFALRVKDIESYQQHFDEHDIAYYGPFPGSRTRPDGSVLEWKMLFPKYHFDSEPLPFLIEWNGEGNRPLDDADLNPSDFNRVIIYSEQPDVFSERLKTIYQLDDSENMEWELENGKLCVKQGTGLEARFKFNQIKFKSIY